MRMWDLKVNAGSCAGPILRRFRAALAGEAGCPVLALRHLWPERPFC